MTRTKSVKKLSAMLMCVAMLFSVMMISASAIDAASDYTATFSSWPSSHGTLFSGDAVVTNASSVSTVKVPINTSFTIYGVSGTIEGVTLVSGTPYLSADIVTEGSVKYLVVTCAESVSDEDFAPTLAFTISYSGHTSSTSGTLTLS